MFIQASSCISFQPTFRNPGFSANLSPLTEEVKTVGPDYSTLIPPMVRRRMSEVMKMTISCTKDCMEQAELGQVDAIIFGTSVGPGIHTKQFMDQVFEDEGELLSPSAFITSTHNTYAGQISLFLENHSYNNTHTHGSLSFELSLADAILCAGEGMGKILVGAVDEYEKDLYNIRGRLNSDKYPLSYGVSCFILSEEAGEGIRQVELLGARTYGRLSDFKQTLNNFLIEHKSSAEDIETVLYSESDGLAGKELGLLFRDKALIDFQKYSGTYLTNSGFGLHYAIDLLLSRDESENDKPGSVLICNYLAPGNLGLILLQNHKK